MIENNEFVALSDEQSAAIIGGGPIDWAIKTVVGIVLNNWGDFTTGLKEGWAAAN